MLGFRKAQRVPGEPAWRLLLSPPDPETCKCPLSNPSEKPGEIPVPPQEAGEPPATARQARQVVSSILPSPRHAPAQGPAHTLLGLSWAWHSNQMVISKRWASRARDISDGKGSSVHVTPSALTLLTVRWRHGWSDKPQMLRDGEEPGRSPGLS